MMAPERLVAERKAKESTLSLLVSRHQELLALKANQREENERRHKIGKADKGIREQTLANKAYLNGRIAEIASLYVQISGRPIPSP